MAMRPRKPGSDCGPHSEALPLGQVAWTMCPAALISRAAEVGHQQHRTKGWEVTV